MLNFPKCFRQNQIRQSFSFSLTYEKIPPPQDQLVLSAANSFKLMTYFFQILIKNLCITGAKTSFLKLPFIKTCFIRFWIRLITIINFRTLENNQRKFRKSCQKSTNSSAKMPILKLFLLLLKLITISQLKIKRPIF